VTPAATGRADGAAWSAYALGVRPVLALALVSAAGFAACNALTGVSDLAVGETAATPDAATPEAGSVVDASVADAQPLVDAAVDDACGSRVVAVDAGRVAAFPSPGAKTLDGELDDWGCQAPLVLTPATVATVDLDASAATNVRAEVRLEWDPAYLYVAYDVSGVGPAGTSTDVFRNDSCEIYIGGPGTLVSVYRNIDRHYIIDHNGAAFDYSTGPGLAPTGLSYAAVRKPNGFIVEARVDAALINAAPLVTGASLPLDLQVNRGNGTTLAVLIWALSDPKPCPCSSSGTTCCCGAANDRPYCNTRRFGAVELR
jgi:Carbohydrate family 9 binding domain-like